MDYKIIGHNHEVAMIDMIQAFYPNEKYKALMPDEASPRFLESRYQNGLVSARFFIDSECRGEIKLPCDDNNIAHTVKLSIHALFKHDQDPPWGILTGIRPAKIASSLIESGTVDTEILAHMQEKFLISPERALLCLDVAKAEKSLLENCSPGGYGLYIGIPFCPSRCLYCSFTSYPIKQYAPLTSRYVDTVKKELEHTAQLFEGQAPSSIYIGGGTPTSLDDMSFSEILKTVRQTFDLSRLKEYTVEAGRPDTITDTKLDIMRSHNVSRISINTQTINDKTLERIGRQHTAAEFMSAYELARKKGFAHINIDLILGLPGECEADVERSLEAITALSPEEVTIHTLAIKRASKLKEELAETPLAQIAQMENLLRLSKHYMDNFTYKPYYMYRQKNTLGNFENVGYRKPGFGSLYNVQIMEESHSIAAVGAGAISKFVNRKTNRIERAFNVKNVDEYMARVDEMNLRKTAAFAKVFGKQVDYYAKQ